MLTIYVPHLTHGKWFIYFLNLNWHRRGEKLIQYIVNFVLYYSNLEEMNIKSTYYVPIKLMGNELDEIEWPTHVGHLAIINFHRV